MDDLDDAIALVYGQPPSGFVAARGALVKDLKAAKRKEDAAAVAALRRPTKLAWALGEAVRREPEAAAAYFEAIAGLAEPGANLRERTTDLRQAVTRLVDGAEGVEPGEVTAALLATAADPGAAHELRLGRLAEVPAGGGFGGLAFGLGPAVEPEPDRRAARVEPEEVGGEEAGWGEAGDDAAGARAAAAAQEQEREEREEREARERAERRAAREAELAEAEERLRAAEAEAEEARAVLARAEAALEAAREAAAAAADHLRSGDP